ncbi:GATOR complex protein WDR24-like [Centruroides sculpturatus]|uniref:GATOR complex protein WDR24-like n=1 Tax=Centruroides sculpturatus TaxID=218467 RepID=UPI000C6DE359|nr:GATOR complex protein WDR24-like [Centruroides sculpturatus]
MSAKTMSITLDQPANALAANKDSAQVAVAGRNVFKVFNIEDDEFTECLNLRVGKNLNLNFSCVDVAWNPIEDNVLATAASNGAVVTWNLNKNSRSKQDIVYQDHKRTVNKVCFHPTEPYILISGSQDGTMKLFDLRKKDVASTFYSQSESVRDVQFTPHHYFFFAAVQENGNVQIWDLRRSDRYDRQFTAHNGPIFTCDWHPEEKKWLATAGRDKSIKVWDLSAKPVLDYCIQTIASVVHVKWRPQKKFNIASSSLLLDFDVNVWDIRRPYIPFAAFSEHKDVTTGFVWRQDPQILLSTSKDCTLYQHVFRDAKRPADQATPIGLDINNFGDISFAASERIIDDGSASIKGSNYSSTKLPVFFRKVPNPADQFRSALSSMLYFKNSKNEFLSMDWFVESARKYKLSGKPIEELCDHNAEVASKLCRFHISQTWQILKILYNSGSSFVPDYSQASTGIGITSESLRNEVDRVIDDGNNNRSSRHNSGNNLRNRHQSGNKNTTRLVSNAGTSAHNAADRSIADISGPTEDDSQSSETDHENTLTNIASGMASTQDFFFGDGTMDNLIGLDYNTMNTIDNLQDWTLPHEVFHPRHPIKDCSPPPEITNAPSSPTSDSEDETKIDNFIGSSDINKHSSVITIYSVPSFPFWNFEETVIDALHFYANQGDVQMAVSILLVLGNRLDGCINETLVENWIISYIELLSRFKLWNIANEVINLSSLSAINTLNQQSTTIRSLCGKCRQPLGHVGWECTRCNIMPAPCSICHQIVRGLYVWCQGCCHGGHQKHMEKWFQNHRECPTGCGHLCEYV